MMSNPKMDDTYNAFKRMFSLHQGEQGEIRRHHGKSVGFGYVLQLRGAWQCSVNNKGALLERRKKDADKPIFTRASKESARM